MLFVACWCLACLFVGVSIWFAGSCCFVVCYCFDAFGMFVSGLLC